MSNLNLFYTLFINSRLIIVLLSAIFIGNCNAFNQEKNSCRNVKLQILGSGGPEIDDGLASSSYLIWINNKASILIDAGGGSSLNFEKSGAKFNDLKAILLTHLHVDHSVELPVYIKAGYFSNRQTFLSILGPNEGGDFPSTTAFVRALFDDRNIQKSNSVYPYLSDNFYQQPSTDFLISAKSYPNANQIWKSHLTDNLSVSAIQVTHGKIPAIAWRIDYRVDHQECSISFSGDMNGTSGNLERLAKNSDWLVAHNAVPENAGRIAKFLHMPPSKIGEIANNAKVKNLVLSHFMKRTSAKKIQAVNQIKKQYKGIVHLSKDLQIFTL